MKRFPSAQGHDPPPLGFVPLIVQEGLQVGRLIVAGVAAAGLSTLTQTQDLREGISGRAPVAIATDQEEQDGRRVVKVSDAIACVKDGLNSEAFTAIVYQIFLKMLVAGDIGDTLQSFMDAAAGCIRSKALQQGNPKVPETGTFYHRVS